MSIAKNHVDLIGFVGSKPELRRTKRTKTLVTSFGLALNESWTDRETGKRQEADTLWVKVRCWGRQAEVMAEYLDAGSLINVVGKLVQAEAWENRDGDLDAQTVVQARNIIFLDRAPRDEDEDEDERPARRNSRRSSSTRRTSSRRSATTTRKSSSRQSSAIDDLSEEEVEELLAVLKERDEKPAKKRTTAKTSSAKRSSKPPVEVEADEDQPEDVNEVEDIEDEEEEKPARKPRQSATKRVPFARAKK